MMKSRLWMLLAMALLLWISNAKKVRIPDNLDDVIDSEEDEQWKAWGRKKSAPVYDPPPDLTGMTAEQMQQEMMKRHIGPSLGFVKLRLDVPRTAEQTSQLAVKWTRLMRTGGIGAHVTAVDLNTMMFNIQYGQDLLQLKQFVLNQPESYELKVGQQAYRRPGDPPLEAVIERIRRQARQAANPNDEL